MNHSARNQGKAATRRSGESAQAGVVLLALVSFAMGIGVSALWFSRKAPPPSAQIESVLPQEAAPAAGQQSPFTQPDGQPSRPSASSPAPPLAQVNAPALDAVKRAIPDIEAASVESGARVLREAALAELQQAVRELQARQKQVEQRLAAGNNSSSDEQIMATKQLKELQLEQMEKIKQIAANAKAQLDAFHQLKEAAP